MAPAPTKVVATTCAAIVAAAIPDVVTWTVAVTMAVMSVGGRDDAPRLGLLAATWVRRAPVIAMSGSNINPHPPPWSQK